MSLPAKVKTWNFSVNHDVSEATLADTCKHGIFQMKEALISFAQWAGVASSNSSSVKNIGDGGDVDLWDAWATDIVNGAGAHSWVVLENSVTGAQLCFDMLSASVNYIDIVYSATGAFNADGTTSARPTDSESIYIHDTKLWAPSAMDGMVVNAMCSNDGKITRCYFHETDGASRGGLFFGLEEMAGVPSQWNSSIPQAVLREDVNVSVATSPTGQTPKVTSFDNTTEQNYMYLEDDTPYEGWNLAYLTTECYHQWSGDQGNPLYEVNSDMDWNDGFPITAMGLFRVTSPRQGGMGAFQDIYLAPEAHQSLTSYPDDASYQWVKWGCFFVPWNGTAPVEAP